VGRYPRRPQARGTWATEDLKAAEKNVVALVDAVAERLGNTRAIARSSYVSPRVINHYMEGSVISYYSEHIEEVIVAEQGGLTEGQKALLELLQRKLRRDWRRLLERKGGAR
jgi:DNA topoisomerase I